MAIFNSKLFVYQRVPHFRHTLFFSGSKPVAQAKL